MKILALDSSGLVASVAILEDDVMVAEYSLCYKKTHSQTLIPMLDEIKKMTDTDLSSIDAIAVTKGPGSFTGLRIGAATAKGLGLALNCPLLPVPTVDALAYNMYGSGGLVCPLMDARRNQVYTGIYRFEKQNEHYEMICIKEQCAVSVDEILQEINSLSLEVVFLGDGVPAYQDVIKKMCHVNYSFAPAGYNRQRAGNVALLGMAAYRRGLYIAPREMEPEYLRMSQAERERMEAEEKKKTEMEK